MSSFELRPLSLGELLDRAFLLYRRNFLLFAGIMVIPAIFLVPARFFFLQNQGVAIPWRMSSPQPHAAASSFVLLFADWIIYSLAQAAITYAVADAYLGRPSTVRGAYGKIRGHIWRILGVSFNVGIRVFGVIFVLVVGAAVAGGAIVAVLSRTGSPRPLTFVIVFAFVIGALALGVMFSMRYTLSFPAVLLEDIKGGTAVRRSVELSKGRRGQIFLAILLGIVVLYALAIVFQGPFYATIVLAKLKGHLPTWLVLSMSVSATIGGIIAGPLLMIALVLCYYDSRIRKEGFDLQHMMASLPTESPAVPIPLA
jgi:hypothetical protein